MQPTVPYIHKPISKRARMALQQMVMKSVMFLSSQVKCWQISVGPWRSPTTCTRDLHPSCSIVLFFQRDRWWWVSECITELFIGFSGALASGLTGDKQGLQLDFVNILKRCTFRTWELLWKPSAPHFPLRPTCFSTSQLPEQFLRGVPCRDSFWKHRRSLHQSSSLWPLPLALTTFVIYHRTSWSAKSFLLMILISLFFFFN